MKNGSILIISNNETTGNAISSKVKLLRECDSIKVVTYIEAISVLNSTQPSVILVYSSSSDSIGIVKEIRNLSHLNKVPIVLVMDEFVEELLLYAFDNGIDDYFFLSDSDSIILMRILLTLQKATLYRKMEITDDIMVSAGIIDKYSGIYKKESAPLVLKNFFSKSLEENLENTVFMCVKPVAMNSKRLNMLNVSNIIKNVPRGNDIVAYGKRNTFYLVLYNAPISGVKSVVNRIKRSLAEECCVFINAAEITKSFEEMETVLLKSVEDQVSSGLEFNYLHSLDIKEAAEVIDIVDSEGKDFKIFKKEFGGIFEKIVAPAFCQMQSEISQKLTEANVKFNISETESSFSISQNNFKSELIITYPAYMKLLIDIKHTLSGNPPSIRRLTFDFEDLSVEKLTSLLKDLANEFEEEIQKER